jgi:hypothetical protein
MLAVSYTLLEAWLADPEPQPVEAKP